MPAVDLLAIDLDGTLLTSSREIEPRGAEMIAEALRAGILVVLASGRHVSSMIPFRDELGLTGPLVTCNGALALDGDLAEIFHATVNEQVKSLVLAYAEDADVHVNLYAKRHIYMTRDERMAQMYRSRVKFPDGTLLVTHDPHPIEATKILFVDEGDAIQRHLRAVGPQVADLGTHLTISEPEYLEFLPEKVNKATGVRAVADFLGIPQGRCAAIGDWLNDLEMIEWAGVGAAIGNAAPEVKAVADRVVATNNDGGVAEFIRYLID